MNTYKLTTVEELRVLEALRQQKLRYAKLYTEAHQKRPLDIKLMQYAQHEWNQTHKLMVKFGYLDF